MFRSTLIAVAALGLTACTATQVPPKDYSSFHSEAPRSILVVPVVNHSNEVDAANLFLTTTAVPLAERGFYVFPTNATRKLMEAEGLGDPGLVHGTQTKLLADVFGADAVLYVEVLRWESGYNVLSSDITTEMLYTLKSGRSDEVLWQDQQSYVHSFTPDSGNVFADLIASAVVAAVNSTRSDFSSVAMGANVSVLSPAGTGLPFGPYSATYGENQKLFPASGTGKISDAAQEALSAPGVKAPADAAED
jgi:hypothetical protein